MARTSLLTLLYFISGISAALPAYLFAPQLATMMSEQAVAGVFVGAAALGLLSALVMPDLIRLFGPRTVAIGAGLFQMGALAWLGTDTNVANVVVLIMVASATPAVVGYSLDMLTEAYFSPSRVTGRTRTLLYTGLNAAWLMSQPLSGFLVSEGSFQAAYIASAISLIPFFVITLMLPSPKNAVAAISSASMLGTLRCMSGNRSLRGIMVASLVLNAFFTFLSIYTAVLLEWSIDSWTVIGLVLMLGMLPYVLLEYPLGKLADRRLGEKELLVLGFLIMAVGMAAHSILTAGSIHLAVVIAIIVGTRIGAAIVEAMTETHFFKNVDADDLNTVSLYRMTRPIGGLIAPLIATATLATVSFPAAFLVFGALLLIGIPAALSIKDSQ